MSSLSIMNCAERMALSVMHRKPVLMDYWAYEYGVILKGIEYLAAKTGDKRYDGYIKDNMNIFIQEDGSIKGYELQEYNIDHVNNGKLLFALYKASGEEKYLKALQLLREQLRQHPRTGEGVFWHKKIYPQQIWLDGLFMGAPFYAEYVAEFGEESEFADIIKQFTVCEKRTKDDISGLLYHAYDESKTMGWCDKKTGKSPNFWGRAMGWHVMALVDVLDFIPKDYCGRGELVRMLNEEMEALWRVRDKETGMWLQVLDQHSRKGNYIESSASAMIVYAMSKGLLNGYLGKEWHDKAVRSYQGLVEEFVTVTNDGWLNLNKICEVAGLGGRDNRDGSFAYYISEPIVCNEPKGVGPFILAACMAEQLL